MAEEYVGTKFKTIFARREAPQDVRMSELIRWCRRFAELGLAPGGAGNMSIRSPSGFIVSRTGISMADIQPEDFVEVLKVDVPKRELTVAGAAEPSSESMMHAAVYETRPEIHAVFHGHCDKLLSAADRLGLPITAREQPYGTPEIVMEILKVLNKHPFFLIRSHGFVSLGATMDEAGNQAEQTISRLFEL